MDNSIDTGRSEAQQAFLYIIGVEMSDDHVGRGRYAIFEDGRMGAPSRRNTGTSRGDIGAPVGIQCMRVRSKDQSGECFCVSKNYGSLTFSLLGMYNVQRMLYSLRSH